MNDDKMVSGDESTIQLLDNLKRTTTKGVDYWLARDLQQLFGYAQWRGFSSAIGRAKMACESVGGNPKVHFAGYRKMVAWGSTTKREIDDIALSRYACYLIAMNGDPRIPEIAISQTYFAIQTRKQELTEQSTEIKDRLELRDRLKTANIHLGAAAKEAGVGKNGYGLFYDAGYRGLYGGLGKADIMKKKGINPNEDGDLLDCIGRAELAANEFKSTQTERILRRDMVKGQQNAQNTHYDVAKVVRNTIEALDGTMPEDLPAEPSIKKLKKAQKPKKLPPTSTQ